MKKAKWIVAPKDMGAATVTFQKKVKLSAEVSSAVIYASAIGVYNLEIDCQKVGNRLLAPGFTSYKKRTLYQEYDVTNMLKEESTVSISVGPGWAVGHIGVAGEEHIYSDMVRAICELEVIYKDKSREIFATDSSWQVYNHPVTFSDIYNGETVDKTIALKLLGNAVMAEDGKHPLFIDNGAPVTEQEAFSAKELIITPKGERVIDFGQNMTGYVSLKIKGKRGERVSFTHAEVLDSDGNFYNDNYRGAENKITYILSGEEDFFKPQFSFQGFRYIRIDEYPNRPIEADGFTAVAIHTDMKRIGNFVTGNSKINQLFHNIVWGQKSNYIDIPTDCPQRNERLGWTGDAQVFCRTAGTNFDVQAFFNKWLYDLRLEQCENGAVMGTCPEEYGMFDRETSRISAGWGDVATIVPWTLYELYGDKKVLEENFELMKNWVEYMHSAGSEEFLWLGGLHYGDWLAMDNGEDVFIGATSNDLIATAFFAYSTELLIKAGEALNRDMAEYRTLYDNIVAAFREYFMQDGMPKEILPITETNANSNLTAGDDGSIRGITQTAITLILKFGLCLEEEREPLTQKLCELIEEFGGRMSTGFIGTPYILHALSENGRTDVAYKLLFNEQNPSWLYSVNHGATTMWEHWNGIKDDGSFWLADMNSFNHYAYGAVGDWLYGVVAGIKINEGGAGYRNITLKPEPCSRLGFAEASIETENGLIKSKWSYVEDKIVFEFAVPDRTVAEIILPNGHRETIFGGEYSYTI